MVLEEKNPGDRLLLRSCGPWCVVKALVNVLTIIRLPYWTFGRHKQLWSQILSKRCHRHPRDHVPIVTVLERHVKLPHNATEMHFRCCQSLSAVRTSFILARMRFKPYIPLKNQTTLLHAILSIFLS